jgi:hypothetical protein
MFLKEKYEFFEPIPLLTKNIKYREDIRINNK